MSGGEGSGKSYILSFFTILILLALGAVVFLYYKDTDPPNATLTPDASHVGKGTSFSLAVADEGAGIASITVYAVRRESRTPLLEKSYAMPVPQATETFTLESTKLSDGSFDIEVTAKDASYYHFLKGNKVDIARTYTLDTRAPVISVSSGTHNIKRGGTALVAYTLNEDAATTGVAVGDLFFPGYKQADGRYLCFFAYPYFMDQDTYHPVLTATDAAGNERKAGFHYNLLHNTFRTDTINLPDSFLNAKMVDFEKDFPGDMTPLNRFLLVNRDLRAANRAALMGIGRTTAPTMLWQGAFERMKGAPRAGFGDHRTYVYNGNAVDEQDHLGMDLASLQAYPVPAGNAGTVVFAGNMGIYGNVVILDHGLGLQSLYAHLSSFAVAEGASVARGQVIGNTGSTGLAGGDHLHFGMLVSGQPVQPLEWWDERWIAHNIKDKL